MQTTILKEKTSTSRNTLSVITYLLVVLLMYSSIAILCNVKKVQIHAGQDGVTELTRVDFSKESATISLDAAVIYHGAFYMPKDFSLGSVTDQGVRAIGPAASLGDFGTIRYVLRLPANHEYTLSFISVAYAQRLFINGVEYAPIGRVGAHADAVVPAVSRYAETFRPEGNTTEIVLHYSNFVHPDSRGVQTLTIGSAGVMGRAEQARTFRTVIVTGTLLTAMLLFFGLYLFSPGSYYLLWFCLICGCIALRGLLIGDRLITLLFPHLSWYIDIRLKYLSGCGQVLFSALYLNDLFQGAVNKRIVRGFILYCLCNALLFFVAPPMLFTQLIWVILAIVILYFAYALLRIILAVTRQKDKVALSVSEQMLLLPGICLYLIFSAFEIYASENAVYLWGMDFAQSGLLIFFFFNVLALLLRFSRDRRALDEVRRNEQAVRETNRMLTRLNRAKNDFLGNISHEMKTPLAVISNCAGLTLNQFRRNQVNEETTENLEIVQHEAVRLGRLVEELLRLALEKERRLILTDTDTNTLLQQAADFCAPICRGKNNRIALQIEKEGIPLRVNAEGLFQVLLNLVTNANRHIQNGEIRLSAGCDEETICFQVSDNGSGIAPALLGRVFERGVSGGNGTGLGLPICKEIIEEHGGQIEIKSGESGTQVSFTLPRMEGRDDV